jgi:CDP-diacylglycerol--serine O-phosphatidyltransferase
MMTPVMGPRRAAADARHYRRGMYFLPSIFTVGNMFCGYACIMFAMRGELVSAAPFIGIAVVLDMLDGRIARMTNTATAFGLELDSLADIISFGVAPAVLAFAWGLSDLGRWGWAAGFFYLTCAAMRLARFNIQTTGQVDKRYFVGMPSPPAAGVVAATIFEWPYPQLGGTWQSLASVAIVVIPAMLMVSTVRYRSFKTLNFGWNRSYSKIVLLAALMVLIATEPRLTLVVLAYAYLLSPVIETALARTRHHHPPAAA